MQTMWKLLFAVSLVLLLAVSTAFADSDNAAIVIHLDEGCRWFAGPLEAAGSVHYVQTQNGQWNLTCVGEQVAGPSLKKAVVEKSTDANPLGTCYTPFGSTEDFQAVFTPSGQWKVTCHGDLTP